MTELSAIVLPIVVSAVIVFVASAVIHMAPLWHEGDYPSLPDQDGVMEALRPFGVQPGEYMMPRAGGSAEMRSPEFAEKMNRGPVMILTVFPNGPVSMAKNLSLWFVYLLVVGLFSGYVASRALAPGADYLQVFRFVGTCAFLAYSLALWQMSIWYRRGWSLTIKETVDGLIYALLTAGTFGWLWPS